MKLALALLAALAFGALPLLTDSNYIVGVAISALIFTVALEAEASLGNPPSSASQP